MNVTVHDQSKRGACFKNLREARLLFHGKVIGTFLIDVLKKIGRIRRVFQLALEPFVVDSAIVAKLDGVGVEDDEAPAVEMKGNIIFAEDFGVKTAAQPQRIVVSERDDIRTLACGHRGDESIELGRVAVIREVAQMNDEVQIARVQELQRLDERGMILVRVGYEPDAGYLEECVLRERANDVLIVVALRCFDLGPERRVDPRQARRE